MKKLLCLILALTLSAGLFVTASAQEEIKIFLNGEEIKTDVPPQLINDRTMVPVRFIFEALGSKVTWDETSSTAKGVKTGIEISMTIGAKQFYRNGKAIALDSPAVVVNGRTLVPVRAIAESFNCKVEWDEAARTVIITTDEIIFGICPDFPPFSYIGKSGRAEGFDIALAVEIADRMNRTPVFKEYDIYTAFEAVKSGDADMLLSGLPQREDWIKELSASESYYTSKQIIITNPGSATDKDNLSGKVIGVLENTVAETYIKEDFDSRRVRTYDNMTKAFDALKRVDIACIITDENAAADMTEGFRICSDAYIAENYVIYISKTDGELLEQVNLLLKAMEKDLTLDNMVKVYIK